MNATLFDDATLKAYAIEPDPIYPDAFLWLGVERVKKAAIASALAPRAKEHLGKNSHIYVVGHDCPNLTQPSYKGWETFLVDACNKGCKLTYYLGKKNEAVIQRFRQIAEQSKARPDQIRVYMRDHTGSAFAESFADQWKTFHFVVFENPRQLWIETNHPEGETEAHDCYYLSPADAEKETFLDDCKQRFEMVVRECASLEFKS
jgi:hypothetical protein